MLYCNNIAFNTYSCQWQSLTFKVMIKILLNLEESEMKFRLQIMGLLIAATGVAQSQDHVHGLGTVFIIQEDNQWQMQYVLPASDALGFEHMPENQQQRDALSQLQNTVVKIENLMRIDAKCQQDAYSTNLDEFADDSQREPHQQHEHGSHKQDSQAEEEHHPNIELSYTIKCSDDIKSITFLIFDNMHSLQKLDVEWSINGGQGSAVVTNNASQLQLN
jgi:hypothetical protein